MTAQEVRALMRREVLEQSCKALLEEYGHEHKADSLTLVVERDLDGDVSIDLSASLFGQPVAGECL